MSDKYLVTDSQLTSVADAIRNKGKTIDALVFPNDFISAIENIGAGVELNFAVVGGDTAPIAPPDNTIWVNTGMEITEWVLSPKEPTPSNGMVWIFTSDSSYAEFNALKQNSIMLFPLSAKQYINGSWNTVSAKSYQNGEWVNWAAYLYKDGDQCTKLSGGWQTRAWRGNSSVAGVQPTLSLDTNKMVATIAAASGYKSGALEVKNDVNLSEYSKVYIDWEGYSLDSSSDNNSLKFAVGNRNATYEQEGAAASIGLQKNGATSTRQISELDISSINGSYSVYIRISSVSQETQITVYNVWLK